MSGVGDREQLRAWAELMAKAQTPLGERARGVLRLLDDLATAERAANFDGVAAAMQREDAAWAAAERAEAALAAAREALREIAERCESEMFASEEQAVFASQRARAVLAVGGEEAVLRRPGGSGG